MIRLPLTDGLLKPNALWENALTSYWPEKSPSNTHTLRTSQQKSQWCSNREYNRHLNDQQLCTYLCHQVSDSLQPTDGLSCGIFESLQVLLMD